MTASASPASALSGWFLYLVRTAAGTLYTGISTDPARRLREHAGSARGARALRGRGPLELVWQQAVGSRSMAQRAEAVVKRLPRLRKEALLAGRVTLEQLLPEITSPTAGQDVNECAAMAAADDGDSAERSEPE